MKFPKASPKALRLFALALLIAAGACTVPAEAQNLVKTAAQARPSSRRSGSIPTKDALELNLAVDRGSVRIFTDAAGEVRYEARVEINAGDAAEAVSGKTSMDALLKQFSVEAHKTPRGVNIRGMMPQARGLEHALILYEVHVPRRYNLAVSSKAGDIIIQDIEGQAALSTGGGNIRAGRIGVAGARGEYAARLESGGGGLQVGDVIGGLRATTAGGHISAGDISGNALLRTDGGHIQLGRVQGTAQLITGGGNIVAAHLGDGVVAQTAGGQIEFGETAGPLHLRSGGGGVRIAQVDGPMELDSGSGSILLAGVRAPLRVSAAAGGITAWLSPDFAQHSSQYSPAAVSASAPGNSGLTTGTGDIVVYLPRELPLTIDALIDQGADHRIVADPDIPLKVRIEGSAAGGGLRAQGALNGGGQTLHLRASAGDIHLRFLDSNAEERVAQQQFAAVDREMMAQRMLLMEMERETVAAFAGAAPSGPMAQNAAAGSVPQAASSEGLGGIARLFEGLWRGGVEVAPEEAQKRLVQAVRPDYPEPAREAGLEGDVTLRIMIGPDGAVRDVRLMAGDPELARAAANAVAQWRYAPAMLDGLPVNVITTVTVAFRLR